MVMMHELAHNVQMNHGKAFWTERNRFAGEMKGLWQRNYTGDGFWGSGRSLESLQNHAGNTVDVGEGKEVEGLCGGTFRSRGRKRKRGGQDRKAALTWREQKDRRIQKKFGKNGVALGEDEDARIKLEISSKGPLGGKPRIAGSKRGRELRAAAALARFEVKTGENEQHEAQRESGTEDDESDAGRAAVFLEKVAVDINGNQLLDSMGFGMVRVCGDEDADDANVKEEMDDFDSLENLQSPAQQNSTRTTLSPRGSAEAINSPASTKSLSKPVTTCTELDRENERRSLYSIPHHQPSPTPPPSSRTPSLSARSHNPVPATTTVHNPATPDTKPAQLPQSTSNPTTRSPSSTTCPICTTQNNPLLIPTCVTCAHVLDKSKDPRAWKCNSEACGDSQYINAGDRGRCGGCGAQR
jgi:DNA-dependent metalloprotease WSS1